MNPLQKVTKKKTHILENECKFKHYIETYILILIITDEAYSTWTLDVSVRRCSSACIHTCSIFWWYLCIFMFLVQKTLIYVDKFSELSFRKGKKQSELNWTSEGKWMLHLTSKGKRLFCHTNSPHSMGVSVPSVALHPLKFFVSYWQIASIC